MKSPEETHISLDEAFQQYMPKPSDAFYQRMDHTPWHQATRRSRQSFRRLVIAGISIGFACILFVIASPTVRAHVADWFPWHPIGSEQTIPADGPRSPSTDLANFVGRYDTEGPAASTSGLTMLLELHADGRAILTSDYRDEPVIVETGTWQVEAPGRVSIIYTHQTTDNQTRRYEVLTKEIMELREPVILTIEHDETGAEYDGIRFWRQ